MHCEICGGESFAYVNQRYKCESCGIEYEPEAFLGNPADRVIVYGDAMHDFVNLAYTYADICSEFDYSSNNGLIAQQIGTPLRDKVHEDLFSFCCYLACSDEQITNGEQVLINHAFNERHTAAEISRIAQHGTGKKFSENVPQSIIALTVFDNMILGIDGDYGTKTACEYMLTLYRKLGDAIIACDGTRDEQEVRRLTDTLLLIREFLRLEHKKFLANPDCVDIFEIDSEGFDFRIETDGVPDPAQNKGNKDTDDSRPGKTLEELLEDLNGLVGLAAVKREISSLINHVFFES